jgi:hypothetical protein
MMVQRVRAERANPTDDETAREERAIAVGEVSEQRAFHAHSSRDDGMINDHPT